MNASDRQNKSRAPLLLGVAAALLLAGLVVGVAIFKSAQRNPLPKDAAGHLGEQPAVSVAPAARPETQRHSAPLAALPSKPVEPLALATNASTTLDPRQLVAELAAIGDSHITITKEQAEKFKANLAELIRQGAAAIPAIREFLSKNVDAYFVDTPGGDQLSFATLRASLFDALKQIGGPEAQTAMVEALNTTSLPFEILELAKNLEQDAPGLYRDQILKATRESLAMAAANQIGSNIEVGPLYRVLESYGGGNAGETVAQTDPLSFQAAFALANLPNGQGLPGLMQMSADPAAGASGQLVATEMIAQLAGQNLQALDALTQMVQNGQIRNAVWQKLAPILAGDEYQPGATDPNAAQTSGSSQSYTVVNRAITPGQINQRLGVIDRFLGLVPEDSSAAAALRHERGLLAARLQ